MSKMNYEEVELFIDLFDMNPLEEYFVIISPLEEISYDSEMAEMEALLGRTTKYMAKLDAEAEAENGRRVSMRKTPTESGYWDFKGFVEAMLEDDDD